MHASVLFILCLSLVLGAYAATTPRPYHVYLSYSGDVTNMKVTYMTNVTVTTNPIVMWYEADNNNKSHIVNVTSSNTQTFTRPLSAGVEYITTVSMGLYTKLIPMKRYTFQVQLDPTNSATWSTRFDFVGLPNASYPITLGLIGDAGSNAPILISNNGTSLKSYAKAHKIDLIIHNGDLAYDLDDANGAVGEQFMDNIQEISARVPYLVSPGNHEYKGDAQAYYQGYWQGQSSLGTLSGSTNPLSYYSFDISYAHIVIINTEAYCEATSQIAAQWTWLDNDLSTFRAKNDGRWLFVFGHRQMYLGSTGAFDSYLQRFGLNCTNPSDFTTCQTTKPCLVSNTAQCGFAIEPLFFKYKVDVSIEGHQHLYQRNYPIGPNTMYETQSSAKYINPKYPTHIITGAGGMHSSSPSYPTYPPFSKRTSGAPHVAVQVSPVLSGTAITARPNWTTARIYNKTHVEFTQLETKSATPIDNFWIVKDSTQPAWTATAPFTVNAPTTTYCV